MKEKLEPSNFQKYLNPYYEEFNNKVIIKMLVHNPSKRIEINELIDTLKDLCDFPKEKI